MGTDIKYSSILTQSVEIAKLFTNWKMLLIEPAAWPSKDDIQEGIILKDLDLAYDSIWTSHCVMRLSSKLFDSFGVLKIARIVRIINSFSRKMLEECDSFELLGFDL